MASCTNPSAYEGTLHPSGEEVADGLILGEAIPVPHKSTSRNVSTANLIKNQGTSNLTANIIKSPGIEPGLSTMAKQNARRRSESGYMSDVCSEPAALVSNLVRQRSIGCLSDEYDLDNSKELGSGSFGTVRSVRHRSTGDTYAMKIIESHGESMAELRKEIQVQSELDHPNICKIVEWFEDEEIGRFYIIMELMRGGMLVSRMKTHRTFYDEAAAATILEKMLSAVLYCHQHGVCHRDIKLDNMLYEDEREDAELKLIDFGFASSVQPGKEAMFDQLGTPSYMAPELWSEQGRSYDSSVDMWALGAVAYMLLSGTRPFHHEDKRKKGRMIRYDPLSFPDKHWLQISQEARGFCSALMQKQPCDRLSASEALVHPWIKRCSRAHSETADAAQALLSRSSVVASIQAWAEAEQLKRLALEVIAFSTPPSRLEDLRTLFQTIDTDASGAIDLHEFKDAMKPSTQLSSDKLDQLFHAVDFDSSGKIDYTEFLAATVSSHGSKEIRRALGMAFSTLDGDADGYITRADLDGALAGKLSAASLDSVMRWADGNGRVSYPAFKLCVIGTHLASPTGARMPASRPSRPSRVSR